jgi:hypothetical protein
VRQPFGAVSNRAVQHVTATTSLPGVPNGQYEVIRFRTGFAHKPEAIETVVLAQGATSWKVAGYYIR